MLPQEIVFVGSDWFALKYTDKGHQREREMHREIGRGFSVQVKKEFPRLFCPSKQVECVCVFVCVYVCMCVLFWSAWSARRKACLGILLSAIFHFYWKFKLFYILFLTTVVSRYLISLLPLSNL